MPESYLHVAAIAIAAVAAAFDWRTGTIPNWLVLPPLLIAPIVRGIVGGPFELGSSIIAMVICGITPYVLFKLGAGGGGDVKLFAAIGAVAGLMVGLEAEFFSFLIAALLSLGKLAWDGKLLRTLTNSLFLALNPILPKKWKREISRELMTKVRIGISALLGTGLAVLFRYPSLWMGAR